MGSCIFLVGIFIREISLMTREKAMGKCSGLTGPSTKETGRMESKMERGSCT